MRVYLRSFQIIQTLHRYEHAAIVRAHTRDAGFSSSYLNTDSMLEGTDLVRLQSKFSGIRYK